LLAVTSLFTAAVTGSGPYETINRIHMRYYNFIFPFILIIAASEIDSSKFEFSSVTFRKALLSLAVGCVGVYAIAHAYSSFSPGLVDSPEIRGITYERNVFYLLGALGIVSAFLFNINRSFGARLFVYFVMPLSIVVSAYYINMDLNQRRTADVYDKAGMFVRQTLDYDERSKLQVITPEPASLSRTLFYIDNPNTMKLEMAPDKIDLSKIDKKANWILLVGNYSVSSLKGFRISVNGYSLVRMIDKISIDFKRENWPGIVAVATGLSGVENWGSWSVSKEVNLNMAATLPKRFNLHLTAHAFGPNIGKSFYVRIGSEEKEFSLTGDPQIITMQFDNVVDETIIGIVVPNPASPKELGLGADARKLGIGLIELRIEPLK
jgi:phosphoglycerol transferase